MSEEPKKTLSITEQIAAIPGRILKPTAYVTVVLLGLGAVGAVTGISYAGDKFDERTDKRVAPAIRKVLDQHETEERARAEVRDEKLRAEMKAAIDEMKANQARAESIAARRFELTINTVLEGRLQPGTRQLSQPQTDGGP